jgi:hypothetical protein
VEAAERLSCPTRALDRLDEAGLLEKIHVFAVGPRYREFDVARIIREGASSGEAA